MKWIRIIAALLMVLSGVLHAFVSFNAPEDPNAMPVLAFGIIYFTIGILLFLNLKISSVLGIIFPVIGIGTGFFVIGAANWDILFGFLFAIDAVVALCCTVLVFNRKK